LKRENATEAAIMYPYELKFLHKKSEVKRENDSNPQTMKIDTSGCPNPYTNNFNTNFLSLNR